MEYKFEDCDSLLTVLLKMSRPLSGRHLGVHLEEAVLDVVRVHEGAPWEQCFTINSNGAIVSDRIMSVESATP